MTAMIARTMIWTTAKSTDVNRRHRPCPSAPAGWWGAGGRGPANRGRGAAMVAS